MKKLFLMGLLVAVSAVLCLPVLEASVPRVMTFQGLLKDTAGAYLSGNYSMTFRIYGAETGGSSLWTEPQTGVTVSSGRFSAEIGSVNPLNLDFSQDYWLSVQVGSDSEMTPRTRLTSAGYALMAESVVNGFSEAQHDALSHRNIEGVKANAANIAKTNFKLDAYTLASANSMGDMIIDTFNDATGIDATASSNYVWRGSPHYDVKVLSDSNLEYSHSNNDWGYMWLNCNEGWTGGGGTVEDTQLGQQFVSPSTGQISEIHLGFYDSSAEYGASWESPYKLWVQIWTQDANGFPASQVGGNSNKLGAEFVNSQWGSGSPSLLTFAWSSNAPSLQNGQKYVFVVLTDYPYGNNHKAMRVSTDSTGSYGGGKLLYRNAVSSLWQVAHNDFDLTFQIKITSNAGSATVQSVAFAENAVPKEAMVVADEILNSGSITYHVSRDNGVTWTLCPQGGVVNINLQPPGTQVRWRAVISGDAQLKAMAIAL